MDFNAEDDSSDLLHYFAADLSAAATSAHDTL